MPAPRLNSIWSRSSAGKLFIALLLALICVAKTGSAAEADLTYQNPIISGFFPDPSICRVGDDYYTVHSSFEYFPGVPVLHSKDLVHWELIGYCLTRPSQLNLNHARASGGIYATTLRYHDGTFYMITTLVDKGGNFYVTAQNPAGPWSEPIWVDRPGIDPSLLFDDDGTVYYTRHEGEGNGYIGQAKIDIKTGKLDGQLKEIWRGDSGVWPEGPHLYKIHGKYYLVIAQGGTSYGHMVNIARSDSPWGPFESDPHNPILTMRDHPENPVQALGHSDFVETPDGWWLICLGIRPQGGKYHTIGRETYLTRVKWSDDGWPVISPVELTMTAPRLPQHPWPKLPARDDFNNAQLPLVWNYIRNPYPQNYSLTENPGHLRLWGSAVALTNQDSPTFIGRRQTDLACRASTQLSFNPQHDHEEAGLTIRGNDKNHFEIGITQHEGERQIFYRKVLANAVVEPVQYEKIGTGDVTLIMEATPLDYTFSYRADGAEKKLGTALTRDLSAEKMTSEKTGSYSFTGVFIGLYATGNGQKSAAPADFDWFEYSAK